jgi:uncharacterized protein YtpQ (UPF0354 family)
VVDDEKSYSYATQNDLEKWEIGEEELYQTAINNLTEKSTALEMAIVPGPNGIVVVNTMDGFDAVRILLPHLQEFFAENLGDSFYFGVPNRDFLICWSKQSDEDFQDDIRQQIAADFEERPYPLSRFAFEMDEFRQIKQHFSPVDETVKNKPWMSNN